MFFPKLILSGASIAAIGGAIFVIDPSMFKTNNSNLKDQTPQTEETAQAQKKDEINNENQDKTEKTLAIQNTSITTPTNYEYLLVETTNIGSDSSLDNFTDNNGTTRNYKCSITSSVNSTVFDETCELYSLNKTNNTYEIPNDWHKKLKTDKPENSTLYILKIDTSKYQSINTSSKEIKLVNKNEDKEFATIVEKKKITQENNNLKTNIILAKIKETGTQEITEDKVEFKCKPKNSSTKFSCKVLTFTESQNEENGITNIDTTKLEKISSSNYAGLNNKHVLIQITDDSNIKTENELRSYLSEIFIDENDTNFFLRAEYVDSYAGVLNTTNLTDSHLIRLEPKNYLIVTVKDLSAEGEKPTANFQSSSSKNYKCKWANDGPTDENCLLIEIDEDYDKVINMKKIIPSNTPTETFVKQKYYKLVSNDETFMSKTFNENDEIIIESNDSNQSGKTYGKLQAIAKASNIVKEGNTQWFISKVKTDLSTSQTTFNFQCKFSGENSDTSCEIYSGTSLFESITDNSFELSGFPKISKKEELKKDKIVMVKLSNKKSINDWSSQTINIKLTDDTTATVDIDVISPSFAYSENNQKIKEIPIILN